MKTQRAAFAACALMCLTLVACSGGSDSSVVQGTTTGSGMSITFRSEEPPATGANGFEVVVRKDGAPVTDADITARFSMPAMPSMNMPAMHSDATLAHVGNGRFRGTGQLSMGGTWNVLIKVTRNGQELGTSSLSIVAK